MNPLKSILVHVDASPHCPVRLAQAQQLAEAHDCVVTALFATSPTDLQYPFGMAPGLEVTAMANAIEASRREQARAHFDAAVAAGASRLQWAELRRDQGLMAFNRSALYADLVLLGQHDPRLGSAQDVPADFVEWTLHDSGKPALVLPYTVQQARPMRTALVAWKESREAARALSAALPLLRQADKVHVVMWNDSQTPRSPADAGPLLACLQVHGVVAEVHPQGPATSQLGDHLLSLAADLGADLLVMGCYGHARIREWVTGGVTRTVLASMTLPVLMSH
jgi:nucleotide-binding universal stress UspA family protein